jgi:hypothetical protein
MTNLTDRITTPTPFRATLILIIACSCDRYNGEIVTWLPDEMMREIDRDRLKVALTAIGSLEPQFELLIPDTLGAPYDLYLSSPLAVAPPPNCFLAVGDRRDGAVHIFDFKGRYSNAIYGGLPDTSVTTGYRDFVVLESGALLFAHAQLPRLTYLTRSGVVSRRIDLPLRVSALAASDDLIYGVAGDERYRDALVVGVDSAGAIRSRLGNLIPYSNSDFTLGLNRGELNVSRDTLWFARFVDGRVVGLPYDGTAARVMELPLFFEMTRIFATEPSADGGRRPLGVTPHLVAFAIDPEGNFWFAQRIEGSRIPGRSGSPFRSVLSTISPDGRYHAYHLGGPVYDVAAAEDLLFATVLDTVVTGRRRLFAFTNPHITQSGVTACRDGG